MQPPKILKIFIAPDIGAPMRSVQSVRVLRGRGAQGDRYANEKGGGWNTKALTPDHGQNRPRQMTIIQACSFEDTIFTPKDSRRCIVIGYDKGDEGFFELNNLLRNDRQVRFYFGDRAFFLAERYCTVCGRVDGLAKKKGFAKALCDRGGIIAEVIQGGIIRVGDELRELKR